MMEENDAAIYVIADLTANKGYVGSTTDIVRRMKEHERRIRVGRGNNKQLQRAYDQGHDLVLVHIPVPKAEMLACEQILLDELGRHDLLYNVHTRAKYGNLGFSPTDEQREKLSRAGMGRVPTTETRQLLSEINKGRPKPRHVIEAMNAAVSVPVEVDGVVYDSIASAARAHDIHITTAKSRVESKTDRFRNWNYGDNSPRGVKK